jgi:hypothetical protein
VPRIDKRLLVATALLLIALAHRAHPAQVLPLPAVDAAHGDAGSVALEPGAARAAVSRRTIFTCVSPRLVIYSDRPCGPLAGTRELRTVTPPGGKGPTTAPHPEAAPVAAPVAAPRKRNDSTAMIEPARAREPTCEQLEAAVTELDQVMRAGYSAREAARLWERWREARARQREADC